MKKLSVLVLDDEKGIRDEISDYLNTRGYDVSTAASPHLAFEQFHQRDIDVALVDIRLPELNGLEVLDRIKKDSPNTEVIMITGHGDMDSAIQALRYGAFDFFNKPFRLSDLSRSIEKTQQWLKLNRKLRENGNGNGKMRSDFLKSQFEHHIIGKSKSIQQAIDLMTKVSKSKDTHVLITGESGTGKELIAKGIHYLSERSENPFHPVNCSAIPHDLFESEFFGHTKGAFTGADGEKKGWFEAAHSGTLFLDEIGDMKPEIQAKLLRVIEDKVISRIGSKKSIPLDLRIISATNQDLKKLVEKKSFREDLYYRLNAFKIHVPALRERREDIPLLIDHFIKHYGSKLHKEIKKVERSLLDRLIRYDYPGNVRELKNMIERAMVLSDENELNIEHFPTIKYMAQSSFSADEGFDETLDLEKVEAYSIRMALIRCNNNKSKAAKLLNISRQSLDRRMERLGIELE